MKALARNLHPHEVGLWVLTVKHCLAQNHSVVGAALVADNMVAEFRDRQADPALRVPPPLEDAEVKVVDLTERAVSEWERNVRPYALDDDVDRAVALMRAGLRYRAAKGAS